jgi:hypothetical protein
MARGRSKWTLLAKRFALRKELIDLDPMDPSACAPPCVLFDHGSLRPAATRNLRVIARRHDRRIAAIKGRASVR